jgi:hypothetical protein
MGGSSRRKRNQKKVKVDSPRLVDEADDDDIMSVNYLARFMTLKFGVLVLILLLISGAVTVFFVFPGLRRHEKDYEPVRIPQKKITENVTVLATETVPTVPAPAAAQGHVHEGEFMFELKSPHQQYHRYPSRGSIQTLDKKLPNAVECCCKVPLKSDFIIACNQGIGWDKGFGLEVFLRQSNHRNLSETYLVVRHQAQSMDGAKCRASWH